MTPRAGEWLQRCAPHALRQGNGTWELPLGDDPEENVTVRLEQDWLLLEAQAAQAAPRQTLEWNAHLRGNVKIVLAAEGKAGVRSEIPLEDNANAAARLQEALAGMAQALAYVRGHSPGSEAPPASADAPIELPALVRETGWSFSQRAADKLAVQLETRAGFNQAMVERTAAGGVHAWVELLRTEGSSGPSEQALGLLLATAGGLVRLCRAVAVTEAAHQALRFEVRFESPPCAAELGHAFSALSVACRLCAEEAKALLDPAVASQYLAGRGSDVQTKKGRSNDASN